jgi:positive regulator of sigma E activity
MLFGRYINIRQPFGAEGGIELLKIVIIIICSLVMIVASFLAGRNFERFNQQQQKAQPTVKAIRKMYNERKVKK